MKIIQGYNNRNVGNFKGIYNNKLLLNSLEKIGEHPATFIAATSFVASSALRPASIMCAPGVDKENKKYACASSIASAVSKFVLTEAVALPVENALNKTDKNPEKYINSEALKKLKIKAGNSNKSSLYNSVSQMLKLSPGFMCATPKNMITVALIPVIMGLIFKNNPHKNESSKRISPDPPDIFKDMQPGKKTVSFKGGDYLAKAAGKLFESNFIQNASKKLSGNGNNLARNMTVATDVLLSASYAINTAKSKKIDEKRKKPLIYNNLIGTAATVLFGCSIDKFITKNNKNFIKKFKEANRNNPKLNKYIAGINVARPTLIFAAIYYGIFPLLSTVTAEKTDKFISSEKKN